MLPERINPQGEGAWERRDELLGISFSRRMVDKFGNKREQIISPYLRDVQRDTLSGGNRIRMASARSIWQGSLDKTPENMSFESFINMSEANIQIVDIGSKASLALSPIFSSTGEREGMDTSLTKMIFAAADNPFDSIFESYWDVMTNAFYRGNKINLIKIGSKIKNPSDRAVGIYDNMDMESIAPKIVVSFGDNGPISYTIGSALQGWDIGSFELTRVSEDRTESNILIPHNELSEAQNLEFQIIDNDNKFTLIVRDPMDKKTIRISTAKNVDSGSLHSIASTPEFSGWESVLGDIDQYLAIEKDL
ncbi:MAG: hypothetical protein HYT07_03305 [Candidatus Levybacteria bacterium]|nr:hypothetical protein [Candidatus Levybacteria bacterium]